VRDTLLSYLLPLTRSEDSARATEGTEKRDNYFSFPRVAAMKKVSAPAGSILFIYTASVDMNINSLPLCLLLLLPCSVPLGLLQAG